MPERVPYTGLPSVAAQVSPTGDQQIQATPAAFGAQIGGAEQQAGAGLEGDAAKLSQAALAMQGMNNERDARNAQGLFQEQIGQAWGKYSSLEGKNAADAYPEFQKQIATIRDGVAGTLGSPQAKNDFLNAAGFLMNRLTLGAATHAASEQKKSWVQSYASNIENASNFAVTMQNDPTTLAAQANSVRDSATQLAAQTGQDEQAAKATMSNAMGKFYGKVILSKFATDPAGAKQLFDSVRGEMDAGTVVSLQQHMKAQGDIQAGAAAANSAYFGTGGSVGGAIQAAAAKYPGVSADTLQRTARLENSPNTPNAVSSTGARGPFQFVSTTARQYGLTNPEDPMQSADAAARLQLDNKKALTASLGREPTGAELYLAHQQGAAGAAALIKNPNIAATAAVGNDRAILVNGGRAGQTASDFVQQWTNKFNAAGPPPGATNDVQDHTLDRATAYDRLTADYQAGKLNDAQYDLAVNHLARLQQMDKAVKADAAEQAFNEYIPKALSAPGTFPMDAMLADARLQGTQKNTIFNIVNHALKGDITKPTEISQAKRTELLDGIRDGTVTTAGQLYDAVAHGGLSTGDYSFVRARFDESQTDNGRSLNRQTTELFGAIEKDLESGINPGTRSFTAGQDFYNWKNFAYSKIAQYQQEKKPLGPLFTPSSPEFLGSDAIIKQFRTPMEIGMQRHFGQVMGTSADAKTAQPPTGASIIADWRAGKIDRAEMSRRLLVGGFIREDAPAAMPQPPTPFRPQVPTVD